MLRPWSSAIGPDATLSFLGEPSVSRSPELMSAAKSTRAVPILQGLGLGGGLVEYVCAEACGQPVLGDSALGLRGRSS